MSSEYTKLNPFSCCLIHGLVRDEQGRKMSKSLNNGIEPEKLIAKYGSDALKMFFTSTTAWGDDLKFNETKLKYYWSVLNKIWNSYQLIKLPGDKIFTIEANNLNWFDCWMLEKVTNLQLKLFKFYDKYEFTIANKLLIDSFYNEFSGIYLELIKPDLNITQKNCALFIFNLYLKLFYPIAPCLSDYLFYHINKKFIWSEANTIVKIKKKIQQKII